MLKQPEEVNTCTSIVTVPEAKPLTVVHAPPIVSEDYRSQIWPIEEQKRKQLEMALQYDELCQLLQKKLTTDNDHNSKAETIKARMRRKLEAKKNNQSKK